MEKYFLKKNLNLNENSSNLWPGAMACSFPAPHLKETGADPWAGIDKKTDINRDYEL